VHLISAHFAVNNLAVGIEPAESAHAKYELRADKRCASRSGGLETAAP
jgi:hypothetical protein